MALPPYAGPGETLWYYSFRFICGAIFLFLILPVVIVVPLSFNIEPYFTFTQGMLTFDPAAFSLRWYQDIFQNGMADPNQAFSWSWIADSWNNAQWVHSTKNSFFIAILVTILATTLGTLAALGLSQSDLPYRGAIMGILISPMIVPLIITAAGMY